MSTHNNVCRHCEDLFTSYECKVCKGREKTDECQVCHDEVSHGQIPIVTDSPGKVSEPQARQQILYHGEHYYD